MIQCLFAQVDMQHRGHFLYQTPNKRIEVRVLPGDLYLNDFKCFINVATASIFDVQPDGEIKWSDWNAERLARFVLDCTDQNNVRYIESSDGAQPLIGTAKYIGQAVRRVADIIAHERSGMSADYIARHRNDPIENNYTSENVTAQWVADYLTDCRRLMGWLRFNNATAIWKLIPADAKLNVAAMIAREKGWIRLQIMDDTSSYGGVMARLTDEGAKAMPMDEAVWIHSHRSTK